MTRELQSEQQPAGTHNLFPHSPIHSCSPSSYLTLSLPPLSRSPSHSAVSVLFIPPLPASPPHSISQHTPLCNECAPILLPSLLRAVNSEALETRRAAVSTVKEVCATSLHVVLKYLSKKDSLGLCPLPCVVLCCCVDVSPSPPSPVPWVLLRVHRVDPAPRYQQHRNQYAGIPPPLYPCLSML